MHKGCTFDSATEDLESDHDITKKRRGVYIIHE